MHRAGIAIALVLLAACGANKKQAFVDGNDVTETEEKDEPTLPGGLPATDAGSVAKPACATASAAGEALPTYLVFMYDRSESMAIQGRWNACRTSMEQFFASPQAAGMNASLQFFPQGDTHDSNDCGCQQSTYANPPVAMRPLPDANAFRAQLSSTSPKGNTPTLPALRGAVQYARQVLATLNGRGRVAIVLVTDGEPNDCNSTPAAVAAEAAAVAAEIKTFVIGVGVSLNLNTVAQSGGTGQAIPVSTTNPAQTTDDLTKALGSIRNALGCEFEVPKPSNGQQLDYNAVNVVYQPQGGAPETLTYNASCQNGAGWHYDDVAAPKRIILCEQSCTATRAASGVGKVEIQFGCATKGGVVAK